MKTLIVAILTSLSFGLVKAQTPDWVTGKSSAYPDIQYVTGVGSGDTRQGAENNARAQIGEVFKVRLNATFSTIKTEKLSGSEGSASGGFTDMTRSHVNVGVEKTLEGTEIAEVWQDPKDMEYYALAVLNKRKASIRIADQISSLATELVQVGKEIDTTTGKLSKLRLLASEKDLAVRRQDLNSDYAILSSSGQGLSLPGISADEARANLARFCQSELVFGLSAKGQGSESAAQVLSDELTGQGLVINTNGGRETHFEITVRTHLESSDTPLDGWYYCEWDIEINLVDNGTGTVMTDISKRGRSGQLTVKRAKERAVYDLDRAVKDMTIKLTKVLLGE